MATDFGPQTMVIDDTFCGDWAGATFAQDCPNQGACTDFAQNTPSAFTEAYWTIRSITVYQLVCVHHGGGH
jgi:hypothetical protein